eukprot:CAMPEP_0116014920 /NCGR_PEP_ID=MMETSP0321-20121206/6536_1 /TAXON_ID=163516 /ORGANISM="Leptocylindrus danicus var. danicus, Strain B650" /LENGTH=842 /DNA_ID=CAMNT_0003484607 /DNA_START=53 /DNA_END=2578 /DNA_ORIENTATION=-
MASEKEGSSASAVARSGEEGIKVAIRMRPLNAKESSSARRVWRVLPKYNSITQTTDSGKPLPERINGRTFFTFDKTFVESTTTAEVYNNVAKGIVQSVMGGLNGTIFAYGQTSSGKTYTMQGGGSEDIRTKGVVHMTARDIFQHIAAAESEAFIEIYNEEVRDLLVSSKSDRVLQIREDPRRGVFVDANETIVTNYESLLDALFAGEKNRQVASTGMNERSSRSHTIFRITVESRIRKEKQCNDTENDDEDDGSVVSLGGPNKDEDGAVLVATLNLVDLAGSESVRHTGATGKTQKEGGKINQSLLTLSRVIAGLGNSNGGHINFRDSKLTRLLQPSLSGNARMAVVCCATPSDLYLEETRSTLQFAARAKLVKTNAQVNEILDDRAIIKKLQKELMEARRLVSEADGKSGSVEEKQLIKALEVQVGNSKNAFADAKKDVEKLKGLMLRGGRGIGVLSENLHEVPNAKNSSSRRKSIDNAFLKPHSLLSIAQISQVDSKSRRLSDGVLPLPEDDDIETSESSDLWKEAFEHKSKLVGKLKQKTLEDFDLINSLQQQVDSQRADIEKLLHRNNFVEAQIVAITADRDAISSEKRLTEEKLSVAIEERKELVDNLDEAEGKLESSLVELSQTGKELHDKEKQSTKLSSDLALANERVVSVTRELFEANNCNDGLTAEISSLNATIIKNEKAAQLANSELEEHMQVCKSEIEKLTALTDTMNEVKAENSSLKEAKVALERQIKAHDETIVALNKDIDELTLAKNSGEQRVEEHQLKIGRQLAESKQEFEHLSLKLTALDDSSEKKSKQLMELERERDSLLVQIAAVESELSSFKAEVDELEGVNG